MAGYVGVRLASLRKIFWLLKATRDGLTSSGSTRREDKEAALALIDEVGAKLYPFQSIALDTMDLEVAWMRELRRLSERVSSRIHSARGLMNDDRRRLLSFVASAKREVDPYIQLDLFSGRS